RVHRADLDHERLQAPQQLVLRLRRRAPHVLTQMAAPEEFPGPPGHGAPRPIEAPLVGLVEADLAWLDRAILLGRRGWGRVHPNPMVGCVLVRDGQVLAEGWHREFGGPHAEVDALERIGSDASGATAYVSLEPCRHEGKTPACTAALKRARVARVVYAF